MSVFNFEDLQTPTVLSNPDCVPTYDSEKLCGYYAFKYDEAMGTGQCHLYRGVDEIDVSANNAQVDELSLPDHYQVSNFHLPLLKDNAWFCELRDTKWSEAECDEDGACRGGPSACADQKENKFGAYNSNGALPVVSYDVCTAYGAGIQATEAELEALAAQQAASEALQASGLTCEPLADCDLTRAGQTEQNPCQQDGDEYFCFLASKDKTVGDDTTTLPPMEANSCPDNTRVEGHAFDAFSNAICDAYAARAKAANALLEAEKTCAPETNCKGGTAGCKRDRLVGDPIDLQVQKICGSGTIPGVTPFSGKTLAECDALCIYQQTQAQAGEAGTDRCGYFGWKQGGECVLYTGDCAAVGRSDDPDGKTLYQVSNYFSPNDKDKEWYCELEGSTSCVDVVENENGALVDGEPPHISFEICTAYGASISASEADLAAMEAGHAAQEAAKEAGKTCEPAENCLNNECKNDGDATVSYTHLTLPTIYSV